MQAGQPEAGPSRPRPRLEQRKKSSRSASRPKGRLNRFVHMLAQEIKRPSILSSSTDSSDDGDTFPLGSTYGGGSNADPRLYTDRHKRHRHCKPPEAESETETDEDEDDTGGGEAGSGSKERKSRSGSAARPSVPMTCVVVNNDFSNWIDPDTGHLRDGAAPFTDDDKSIMSGTTQIEMGKGVAARKVETARSAIWRIPWLDRLWSNIYYFFDMSFPERPKEMAYKREVYYANRQMALVAVGFFLMMWALVCGTTPKPFHLYPDWLGYVGLYGLFTLPLVPLTLFNMNYRYPKCYQVWLALATWVLPDLVLIELKMCAYFETHLTCGNRSFFIAFASAIGQPTLAAFALGQNRLLTVLGAIQFFVLMGIFEFNSHLTPMAFYRDAVYYVVFHIIFLVINSLMERSSRQTFELREQLKLQFKATQRAQLMEKRAADLKKRFVSYIFHEVRVPLNTASLALQNLDGDGLFKNVDQEQVQMVHGLAGSLSLMEKVLNDVLSFNRMESGKFTQAKHPFSFHRSIELTTISHSASAHTKNLTYSTELDPRIDQLCSDFVGDELRLRQITSNLVSNAIKFTNTGGIKLVTRLISPLRLRHSEERSRRRSSVEELPHADATTQVDLEKGLHNGFDASHTRDKRVEMAVVRIEVHDTGVGLRPQDMVQDRLFSPYVQTEIGRRQGGKGTGLGLALIRQIVELSKGRLGVDSEFGKGSVFWIEMPYKIRRCAHSTVGSQSGGGGSTLPTFSDATVVTQEPGVMKIVENSPSSADRTYVQGSNDSGRHTKAEESIRGEEPSSSLDPADDILKNCYAKGSPDSQNLTTPTVEQRQHMEGGHKFVPGPLPNMDGLISPLTSYDGDRHLRKKLSQDGDNVNVGALNALVVDDDKLTRMMMTRMLKRLGHTVNQAENGKAGLEMITDAFRLKPGAPAVDVIFLDNQMPFMSGVEVAREVRALGCPVFIAGCTGNALREDQDEYLAAGADRILTKPIKQAGMEEIIAEARKRLAGENVPKVWEK